MGLQGDIRRRREVGLSLVGVLATLTGLFIFARGFFPVKPFLPGYAEPVGEAVHSRLAFILVDALRIDLVFNEEKTMPFVASLVKSGKGLPFTAIAQPPTVTLPRLKALTTGSNPTFLDAMLNIAEDSSAAVLENVDSWVRQLALGSATDSKLEPKKKVVFFGDDTWLRLFPENWFAASEGVSSFFVSDTKTVDTNVTRHLNGYLREDADWDALILHYLGLDHVGHLGGPQSPLMRPKLLEMDAVVERVFKHLEKADARDGRSSLLVLVGDHGMSEMGNHGGSTEGETSAALLLASTTPGHSSISATYTYPASGYHRHEVVNQIDVVPTLAALLGFGIPTNSMGRVVETALVKWSNPAASGRAIKANAEQVLHVLSAVSPSRARELLCEGKGPKCTNSLLLSSDPEALAQFLAKAQETLLTTFGNHDLTAMGVGLLILSLPVIIFSWITLLTPLGISSGPGRTLALSLVLYVGSFFATTFLEEEHEIWFFFTTSAIVWMLLRDLQTNGSEKLSIVGTLAGAASVRIMRAWSHNGQKERSDTSLSSLLTSISSTKPHLLSWLMGAAVATPTLFALLNLKSGAMTLGRRSPTAQKTGVQELLSRAFFLAIVSTALLAQAALVLLTHLVRLQSVSEKSELLQELGLDSFTALARTSYAAGTLAFCIIRVAQSFEPALWNPLNRVKLAIFSLFLLSLTRPSNSPLVVLLWGQFLILQQKVIPELIKISLIIALQKTSFFAFGGSNSLATVDLSQAYNGVTSYDVKFVSLLTYLSNFSGPVFWSLASLVLVNPSRGQPNKPFIITSLFHSTALLVLAASATHFRNHLFTFTVFSPALLFQGVWSTWVHLGSDVLLAQLMQL
ncbi:alkaline phosphatase-like protein [Meredithblackwellia eburnea MCA 4105]